MLSESSEVTEEIGRKIGKSLRGGEVIELISDLGGGKTTLVRGIAAGAGSRDKVSSPTFTLSKVYSAKTFQIIHYDFYRLQDPGLMEFELAEALSDKQAVLIVEWANIVQDVLPKDRLIIRISAKGEFVRRLDFEATEHSKYLLEIQ